MSGLGVERRFTTDERRRRLVGRQFLHLSDSVPQATAGLRSRLCAARRPRRRASVEPYAALLPGLDVTTMGWFDRDWYLGGHRAQLFDRNGNAGPTAWWDGRVVGGWYQDENKHVHVQLLEDPGRDGRPALTGRAAELTSWLDGVRIRPGFPSPLSKACD